MESDMENKIADLKFKKWGVVQFIEITETVTGEFLISIRAKQAGICTWLF